MQKLVFIFVLSFLTLFTSHANSTPVYVSKDSRVYHHDRNCSELNTDNLIEFKSSKQADSVGAIPCKHCDPSAVKETPASSYQPVDSKSREVETQNEKTNHTDMNSDYSKLILGKWRLENEAGIAEYYKDRGYKLLNNNGEKLGYYNIKGDILILEGGFYSHDRRYRILELSASTYRIVGIDSDKGTYNATKIIPQYSAYYSSVVFSLLKCSNNSRGINRTVRGDVPLSIDLSNDAIAKQILEDGKLFAEEKCPIEKNHDMTTIELYQLDEKYPQFKDDVVIDATVHWTYYRDKNVWNNYRNNSASIANKKHEIEKKEREEEELIARSHEFVNKYRIQSWPSTEELSGNPFVYEGKTIAIIATFQMMQSATNGLFGRGEMPFVVSSIPKGTFRVSGASIALAGTVLGNIEYNALGTSMYIPHLKFVGVHFCEEGKDCTFRTFVVE